MRIDVAAQTDIGRRKRKNEDFYGVFRDDSPGLQLFREGRCCVWRTVWAGTWQGRSPANSPSPSSGTSSGEPAPAPVEGQEDQGYLSLIKQYIVRANDNVHKTNQDP